MLLSGDGGGFPFAFLLLNKEGIANNVAAKRKQSGKHRPMVTHSDFLILHEFPSREIEAKWREFLEDVECPAHFNAPEYLWNLIGMASGHLRFWPCIRVELWECSPVFMRVKKRSAVFNHGLKYALQNRLIRRLWGMPWPEGCSPRPVIPD